MSKNNVAISFWEVAEKKRVLYFFRCNLDPLKWRVFTVQTCSMKYKLADLQSSFRVWVSWYVFLGSGLFLQTSPKCLALNRTECSNEVLEDSLENIGDAVAFILRWVPQVKCFKWSCFCQDWVWYCEKGFWKNLDFQSSSNLRFIFLRNTLKWIPISSKSKRNIGAWVVGIDRIDIAEWTLALILENLFVW